MAKRGVKKKEHERLEDHNIEKVISLLDNTPPITKKEACDILNISYNTTRLGKIIEEYKEQKEARARRFNANKGQPLSDNEIGRIIEYYLSGDDISTISEYVFRGPSVVKNVLTNYNVPTRPKGDEKHRCSLLPESMAKSSFSPGNIVWSAKYHSAAEIITQVKNSRDNETVYRIFVFGPTETMKAAGFFAHQRVEDLGSLEHLEKYVNLERLTKISA